MRVFLLILVLFLGSDAFAQRVDVGELAKLDGKVHDSLYYEYFKLNRLNDPKLAISYAQRAWDLASTNGHKLLEIKAANAVGWLEQKAGFYERAIDTHKRVLKLGRDYGMEDRVMYSYENLGHCFFYLNSYDNALENYFHCLELARKLGITETEIASLSNIGLTYGALKNYTESINYLLMGHELIKQNGGDGLDENYLNTGFTYLDVEDVDKAKRIFQEMAKKDGLAVGLRVATMRGLSNCYLMEKDYNKCIYYSNEGLKLAKSGHIVEAEPWLLTLLASAEFLKGDFKKSLVYCDRGIVLAKRLRSHANLQEIYGLESKVFYESGEYMKSRDALSVSVSYKDSIFNEKFTENFKNIHLKLEQDKNDNILKEKDKKLAKQEQFSVMLVWSGVFLVIITLLSLLFLRIIRRNNRDLEERVRERTKEIRRVLEELDTYIYRTSHDIKGPLARLKGLVELALLDRINSDDYLGRLVEVIDNLNDIITRVQVISEIHKYECVMIDVGIEELIDNAILLQAKTKHFGSVEIIKHLRVKKVFTDGRILSIAINNIINNAYRYVSARRNPVLVIETSIIGDHVCIAIMDNGQGFDPQLREKVFELFVHGEGNAGAGLGLHLSKLAVEKVGGKIEIVDNDLTTVQIEIPV